VDDVRLAGDQACYLTTTAQAVEVFRVPMGQTEATSAVSVEVTSSDVDVINFDADMEVVGFMLRDNDASTQTLIVRDERENTTYQVDFTGIQTQYGQVLRL
jgi:hypothetical protein